MQIELCMFNLLNYIPRTLAAPLKEAAAHYPVVTLTGPRQSGKTTLSRKVFPEHDYVSLEYPDHRQFALEDPRGFLGQFKGRVILDEVQQAPDLFSYIQGMVDEDARPGRFILTGSQNFLLLAKISQTLAGRSAVLHLLPFTLDEILQRIVFPLEKLGQSPPQRSKPDTELWSFVHGGFYPRIHDQSIPAHDWLKNYYQTYLVRDVRDLASVGDLEAFSRFVGLCAGRCGQLLNYSSLAADCGISHTTARRWMSVLEASFVVVLLRPHFKNFNKRLIKSPKLYFIDTGLLCSLLRIGQPEDLRTHALRGSIFENFVVAELYKRRSHSNVHPGLFFWRDATGHEVDLLIEKSNSVSLLEIKSGETVSREFFKGIRYWRKLAHDQTISAGIVHAGDQQQHRDGVHIYPWWNF